MGMASSDPKPPPVPPEQVAAEEAAAGYVPGTVVERPITYEETRASSPPGAVPPGTADASPDDGEE